ncbi:guanylate kinase [Candidatus Dependentiae bacterium]
MDLTIFLTFLGLKKIMSGKLFIVSAPSGAGKTSLVNEILTRLQPKYPIDRLVTYTSREIRPGEREGIDFCYVTPQEFEKRAQEGFFLECSKEYECYYGSPNCVKDDLKKGDSRVLVIDRNGAKQVVDAVSDAVTIWIYAPSIDVLKKRLVNRGLNSVEQIERRIELAKTELEEEEKSKFYKYHVLNDNFDQAADNLESIFINELKKF